MDAMQERMNAALETFVATSDIVGTPIRGGIYETIRGEGTPHIPGRGGSSAWNVPDERIVFERNIFGAHL